MKILALCGSLRARSTNGRVLALCQEMLAADDEWEMYEGAGTLAPYNPDNEKALPASIVILRARVRAADALLIATPEYAHGMPGVLKSLLDCLVSDSGIVHKPVGIIFGAASDASHTVQSVNEVLKTMSAKVSARCQLNLNGLPSRLKMHPRLSEDDRAALRRMLEALLEETLQTLDYDRRELWKALP